MISSIALATFTVLIATYKLTGQPVGQNKYKTSHYYTMFYSTALF